MTRDALMAYAQSPHADLRTALYQELYGVYEKRPMSWPKFMPTACVIGITKQVGLRHYASPIAVRNVSNDVPDAAVDALLDVSAPTPVSSNATLSSRLAGWAWTSCAATISMRRWPSRIENLLTPTPSRRCSIPLSTSAPPSHGRQRVFLSKIISTARCKRANAAALFVQPCYPA